MDDQYLDTPIKQWVAHTWQEIFNIPKISVDADFFDLGGNSLTALKFLSCVEKSFGEEALLPNTLFETPGLKEIAEAIEASSMQNLNPVS